MLRARGVRVTGQIGVRHRPLMPADEPAVRGSAPPARPPAEPVLAKLVPPPLADDVKLTMKVSQNLHAELFLRRVTLAASGRTLTFSIYANDIPDGTSATRAMYKALEIVAAAN